MNKTKSKKDICIERIKYLMICRYSDILEDDKINKILIKIVLDELQYNLLLIWTSEKWNIKKTADILCKTQKECEEDINKIIDNLIPILWSYKNNPFINDMERRTLIRKKEWIGDTIIERFLNADMMMIPVSEYIDAISK